MPRNYTHLAIGKFPSRDRRDVGNEEFDERTTRALKGAEGAALASFERTLGGREGKEGGPELTKKDEGK